MTRIDRILLGCSLLTASNALSIKKQEPDQEPLYDENAPPPMVDDVSDEGIRAADEDAPSNIATSGADVSSAGIEIQPWQLPVMTSGRVHHTLRICNAYPYSKPMNIFLNEVELYANMLYKECDDFLNLRLVPGDILRFKTEVDHHQHSAGIFEISDLPHYSGTLLLVISRHDQISNAVRFESHVFKESDNAQVAVIDTYHGHDKARIRVMHANVGHDAFTRAEDLPFGSVHRINSGLYDVVMDVKMGKPENVRSPLVALPTHNYVVLRVGIEDGPEADDDAVDPLVPGDQPFPEEMIVFPLSKKERLKNAAPGTGVVVAIAMLVVGAML